MAQINDITEELHKEIEAVPEEDRALLLRIVRSFREGVVTEPWFEEAVREGIRAWGLELCAREPSLYSDTVSAIVVPSHIDSAEVIKTAYYRYNMSLGSGLTKVAGKVFRIGHLGNLNEIMVLQALAGSEMALRDSGVDIELGSGVAAAQATFIRADASELNKAA